MVIHQILMSGILCGHCAALATAQVVLWDNGEFDRRASISCERDTLVDESWAVDDAIFEEAVVISGYRWYTILWEDWGGERPVAVDVIVLTDRFEKVVELRDLQYEMKFVGDFRGFPYYRIEVHGLDITLPSGRYYLGGRPVGQGRFQAFTGLNNTLLGRTEAFWRSKWFGFPNWVSVGAVLGTRFDIAFTVFGHVVREEVEAESFTVPLGRHLSGEVSDLHESDDRYITIRNRALMAMTLPMIRMEVQGTTAVETASRITVTVETAASNLPKQPLQRLALFDYATESWVTIDERTAPPVDTVVEVIVEDDPTRFIAPGAGQLKLRLDWFDPGATTPWGVRIDHTTWTVER